MRWWNPLQQSCPSRMPLYVSSGTRGRHRHKAGMQLARDLRGENVTQEECDKMSVRGEVTVGHVSVVLFWSQTTMVSTLHASLCEVMKRGRLVVCSALCQYNHTLSTRTRHGHGHLHSDN